MWDYITRTIEIEGLSDIPKTYVGDAAGRIAGKRVLSSLCLLEYKSFLSLSISFPFSQVGTVKWHTKIFLVPTESLL
jgi:hypothetical protein